MIGVAGESPGRSDVTPLEALYRSHASGAVRLAYVLTADAAAAQDVAHEAFVRVGGKLAGLRNPDQARAYLFKTTLNLCRSRARRSKAERAATERLHRPSVDVQPDVGARDEMWGALLRLPLRQRSALFLRYYEDLSEVQAAEALGCSVGAMKSLVNRGLKGLRSQLEGASDE
ncbi:MAG TPA: sigma-70 family RNA polymerase sigma factor [Actinomycetota bacterium]|nr:sigma-70 family RNA polymerase sigma factor [Actinomycetota bacterium]